MDDSFENILRPLVTGWVGKIEKAKEAKKGFDSVSKQCMAFFTGAIGFMWDPSFQKDFLNGANLTPRFKMTLNKAFEFVAQYGPSLYWRNPQRQNTPRKHIPLTPDLFGPQGDPRTDQMFQQIMQQEMADASRNKTRCNLFDVYLNYTPTVQPGGGLARHSKKAITESLVKGRGLLWVRPYQMPGSDKTLTGCFYDSVDNLLIDPDAEELEEAYYVMQKCCHPKWQVEREYKLPAGSLKGHTGQPSATALGEIQGDDLKNTHTQQGKTFDNIVYYKIWSKGGIGARLVGVDTELKDRFDEVVGDYAFIVVAPGVPWPLNCHPERLRTAYDEDVKKCFEWPVPFWLDQRWPFAALDYYNKPRSPWAVAPLAPGLGELTFLNVMVSHLANRIWSSQRDLIAVTKSAATQVLDALKSGNDQEVIQLDDINKNINETIQFLQQPQTNPDSWRIIEAISEMFDKRVGLTELMYGLNPGGTQSRSAGDSQNKAQGARIRPEYMAGVVEDWQSEAADMEKMAARWFVEGSSLGNLVGPVGAHLWDELVSKEDPEIVIREMRSTVAANSARKPNKDRDIANINQILPVLLPIFEHHADVTTNTGPLNALINNLYKAIEQDPDGMELGPQTPQAPPPEVVQMQQAEQQAKVAKLQADAQSSAASAQESQADALLRQTEAQLLQAEHEQAMVHAQELHQQSLQHEAEGHVQGLQVDATKHLLNSVIKAREARQRAREQRRQPQGSAA